MNTYSPPSATLEQRSPTAALMLLRLIAGLCVFVALYRGIVFYLEGEQVSEGFRRVWGWTFAFLLAFWVEADSRQQPRIIRPSFDFGAFVFVAWLIYLPYYLLRTRGSEGWVWILGLLALIALDNAAELIAYGLS